MLRTDLQIRKWKPASSGERKACGESLYIRGWNDGTKSFELRAQRQFITLGHYPALNLSAARHLTITSRSLLKDGIIPIEKLKLLVPRVQSSDELVDLAKRTKGMHHIGDIPTFDTLFHQWHETLNKAGKFTHPASFRRPISQYKNHAKEHIGHLPIDQISRSLIKTFLQPLFLSKPVTAKSLLEYIRRVLQIAFDDEIIEQNPCPSLKSFTEKERDVIPHPSLHWDKLPWLWKQIECLNANSAVKTAMQLTIISIHRASVVANMRVDQYDPETGLWLIPKKAKGETGIGQMKSKREFAFIVPRNFRAKLNAILLQQKSREFMFSIDGRKPITPETLRKNFKKFDGITTHGFRNTFKVWAKEHLIDDFLADRYADHSLSGLDRSYRRTDMFELRTELAERYLAFIEDRHE